MTKRITAMDIHMNEVIWYGGFPMRRGDAIADMDKFAQECAKADGRKSWLSIRDAGLSGNYQFNERHPMPPDTEPITLKEFYELTGIERG